MQRVVAEQQQQQEDEETEIENWSSTHSVKTKAYLQPESVDEVSRASARAFSCVDISFSASIEIRG